MSQVFFIFLLLLATLIRLPLSILIVVLRPLVPFFKKRLNFERQNFLEEECRSFKKDNLKADYCFEISSEGELEQVRPLIEAVLKSEKKVEIIYSSPSVEVKCHNLYKSHPELIRLFRLPLLSASPVNILYFQSVWEWVSAPVVVFCRYDFFPELLTLKLFKKKFILVSGAFKKTSWFKLQSFMCFDVVIAATDKEKENFTKLFSGTPKKVFSCDFRVPRITARMQKAAEVLAQKDVLTTYIDVLKALPADQKIILGSAWPSDMPILKDEKLIAAVREKKLHLLIAPHKLDDEFVLRLKQSCIELFGEENVGVVNNHSTYTHHPVVILQMGGVLCELYSLFSLSYVGGGYERSIHSVLEPFVSNNAVVVGPKVGRSTEYDLASSLLPDEIHVLNRADSFYTIKESMNLETLNRSKREELRVESAREMKAVIAELLG